MSESGGGDRGNEDDRDTTASFEYPSVDPELRESNIQRVSFDWCETVASVGKEYWKSEDGTDLTELSAELGLPPEDVRRAARAYYCIYDVPTEDLEGVANGAFDVMIHYFRDHESVAEIAADRGSDPEEVRRWAREYLGGVERNDSIDELT